MDILWCVKNKKPLTCNFIYVPAIVQLIKSFFNKKLKTIISINTTGIRTTAVSSVH